MVNQGTQMLSMIVAGWLASSSLRNFHTRLLGVHLGPIDTILSVGALLIVLGGLNAFRTLPRNMRAAAAERARAGAEGTEEAAAA